MNQPTVSLTDLSTYLPGEPVGADYYAQFAGSDHRPANLISGAPKFRHQLGRAETLRHFLSEIGFRPRISTLWAPISPTRCSCATGAKHSRFPNPDTWIPL